MSTLSRMRFKKPSTFGKWQLLGKLAESGCGFRGKNESYKVIHRFWMIYQHIWGAVNWILTNLDKSKEVTHIRIVCDWLKCSSRRHWAPLHESPCHCYPSPAIALFPRSCWSVLRSLISFLISLLLPHRPFPHTSITTAPAGASLETATSRLEFVGPATSRRVIVQGGG